MIEKLICKIFGHNTILRDWYPTDPITHRDCLRCGEILNQWPNPTYMIPVDYTIRNQRITSEDPYGEEIWEE